MSRRFCCFVRCLNVSFFSSKFTRNSTFVDDPVVRFSIAGKRRDDISRNWIRLITEEKGKIVNWRKRFLAWRGNVIVCSRSLARKGLAGWTEATATKIRVPRSETGSPPLTRARLAGSFLLRPTTVSLPLVSTPLPLRVPLCKCNTFELSPYVQIVCASFRIASVAPKRAMSL